MELTPQFAMLVPVIIGLVQVLKKAGLNGRYAPLSALLFGALGAFFLIGHDPMSLLQGVVAGLSASGLFAGYKTTIK